MALDEVSKEVLLNDIAERNSENPLAYKDNINVNQLGNEDELLIATTKSKTS